LNLPRTIKPALTVFLLIAGMFAALAVSMLIIIINLNPPANDVQLLVLFMGGSGSASVVLVYGLYRTGLLVSFTSVRWTLLAIIVLPVALMIVNVWLTAQLMFISYHDLTLTIALLIFASVVAMISVFFIASAWIERIYALGQIAAQVARGELKMRLQVRGKDELAQLTLVFNQMMDSLEAIDREKHQLEQTRRDLIAWISHDLRTPLAAARAMNESILDGIVTDAATVLRYNRTIDRELAHLSSMVEDLFALAQLDAGNFKIKREQVSLRDLVSDTLGSLSAQTDQMGIVLEGVIEPGVDMVEIAPDKIQRVLYNLIDNALQHTPPGHRVVVHVRPESAGTAVSVCNTGSVIPLEELPHLFTSFFRGERSRRQRTGGERGTGLGLAIVRGFVEAHGGKIDVTSTPEEGTRFTFTLPYAP
jgi:signal transduction histidine kinase